MSVWTEPIECALCGSSNRDVRYQLVQWRDALPGMSYAHVPRCLDRLTCQRTVQAKGETWPLRERVDDRTPSQVYDNAEKQEATREDRR